MMQSLCATGLHFAYVAGVPVLEGVDLSLRPRELVALVGPNGSGKSTLLRLLAGLLVADSGSVELDGRALGSIPVLERARHLAFLPQRVRPLYEMSVRQVVQLARHPHRPGWGESWRAEDHEAVRSAVRQCDVGALLERPFPTLSGGERQRVLLAAALAQSSEGLVLDEPTTALDPHHQIEAFDRLRRIADAGAAVLVATHDLNLAATFAHRMVLLDRGRIDLDGTPREVVDEGRLERVFGSGLHVGRHEDGTPWVLPRRRSPRS